jgi:hypothetical protein
MSDLAYSSRVSLADSERSWLLTNEALVMTKGPDTRTIPYASIDRLRLITFAATGGSQGRAILTINGLGKRTISSHHYASLGNVDDRSASYVLFVRELAQRTTAANPQARFVSGSFGIWLAWSIVCLLVLGAAFVLGAAVLEVAPDWIRLFGGLAMMVVFGSIAVRWAVSSFPQSIDPKAIPDNILV